MNKPFGDDERHPRGEIRVEGDWTWLTDDGLVMRTELFRDEENQTFKRATLDGRVDMRWVCEDFYQIFKRDFADQVKTAEYNYQQSFIGGLESL